MALTQTGENQSKIGVNLSKIIGLKQNAEKMKAVNMERQKGGFNAVYFNGKNAGTESGGTEPTCTPCGGGSGGGGSGGGGSGGGGSGGGGSGGGGSGGGGGGVMPCDDCVTLAKAAEMTANGETPCCISGGKDCETGEPLPICLSENCGEYGKGCNPPPPPNPNENCSTVVVEYTEYTGFNSPSRTVYLLSTLDKAEGDLAAALEKSLQSGISICGGGGEVIGEFTANPSKVCKGKSYNISYTYSKGVRTTALCAGSIGGYCNLIMYPSLLQYDLGLQNWEKPSGKYFKNGKFYDACGIDASDEITVCDENGNQYKIKANNGKPKVTPVTA